MNKNLTKFVNLQSTPVKTVSHATFHPHVLQNGSIKIQTRAGLLMSFKMGFFVWCVGISHDFTGVSLSTRALIVSDT